MKTQIQVEIEPHEYAQIIAVLATVVKQVLGDDVDIDLSSLVALIRELKS